METLIKYRKRLESKRDQRIYVRVSTEEKAEIQAAAKAAGYQSLGAYLVTCALESAHKSTQCA